MPDYGPPDNILTIGADQRFASGPESGRETKTPSKRKLWDFFQAQIRIFEHKRRIVEKDWRRAERAFRNLGAGNYYDLDWYNTVGNELREGLPYAATMTTVAALAPKRPSFQVKAKRSSARKKAKAVGLLLKNAWATDERQRLIQKAIIRARHNGFMVGRVVFETDYDVWQKKFEEEKEAEDKRAELTTEDRQLEELVDAAFREEIQNTPDRPHPLTGQADHNVRWGEVGARLVDNRKYVADPEAENFVTGPRWEGERIRMRLTDLRENPRYDKTVASRVMPNAGTSSSIQAFFGRNDRRSAVEASVPLSHQMVDVYEIVDYTDPRFKEEGGALITLSLDAPGLLEYRANPYGRRLYRVSEWNGDEFEQFPQTDFEGWEDIWHASKEVLYRMVRALRRSPNGKIVTDSNNAANADEIDGLLDNDDASIVPIDLGNTNDVRKAYGEIATRQVSPEYANALNVFLNRIRLVEGLGPNQFGGAPLKSETSATEAGEIGTFARARLDVKERAVESFVNGLAKDFVSTAFRFLEPDEIAELIGDEQFDASNIAEISKSEAGDLVDLDISIESGSMAPDSDSKKIQKIQLALGLMAQDPIMATQLNRDVFLEVINDVLSLDTGDEMFVGQDSEMATLNRLVQQVGGAGGKQGSAPRQPGQSNAAGIPGR